MPDPQLHQRADDHAGRMARMVLAVAVAAVLMACGGSVAQPPAERNHVAADVLLPPVTQRIDGVVPPNTTLAAMLREHGLAGDAAASTIEAAREVFDLRRLRALQPFSLVRTFDGALRHLEYEIDATSLLRVVADTAAGTFHAAVLPIAREREVVSIAGAIDNETPSLFQAVEGSGETPELAVSLAELFSGQIDFNTELQPGDRFAVSFERFTREGRPATYGVITAAEFQNGGRMLRAFRYEPTGGKADYYDEEGRSIRRFFLRSPLKFEPRITSGFSARRMHPVLHTARAHRGVDYGAPTGAQVLAVASGTVLGATYDRANGRMVRLRHASGYESYYLHLSAFARGIRAGARVEQGQTVGRVGSTGLATGPHLHFGLKKHGVFVNPIAEQRKLPPGEPIRASERAAFSAERDRALEALTAANSAAARTDVIAVERRPAGQID